MPTIIGHAISGAAFAALTRKARVKILFLSICCAVFPDLDVVAFRLGIPYEHWLGHRGFSHSILFAALLAAGASLFALKESPKVRYLAFLTFFLSALSHGLLDAMTNGGLGVAFFSPFQNERYFLPWRPVEVSPLSLKRFFSERGFNVLKSEFTWVILPSLGAFTFGSLYWYKSKK